MQQPNKNDALRGIQKKGRGVIFQNANHECHQHRGHTWLDVVAVAAAGMAGCYLLLWAVYRALLWGIGL